MNSAYKMPAQGCAGIIIALHFSRPFIGAAALPLPIEYHNVSQCNIYRCYKTEMVAELATVKRPSSLYFHRPIEDAKGEASGADSTHCTVDKTIVKLTLHLHHQSRRIPY